MVQRINNYLKYFYDGIKLMFRQFFNKDTNKLQRANMWTFLRLFMVLPIILFGYLAIIHKSLLMLIIGGLCIAIGGISDMMDGKSARKWHSITEFGIKFDQLVDKVFSITILTFIACYSFDFIITLLLECIIALVNTYYFSQRNIKAKSNFVGKIKQTVLFIDIGIGFLTIYFDSMLRLCNILNLLVIILQVITLFKYVYDNEKNLQKRKTF